MLPKDAETSPGGFHVWLHVAEPWTRGELVSRLRSVGVGVVRHQVVRLLKVNPLDAVGRDELVDVDRLHRVERTRVNAPSSDLVR
jgi:hypothetical protein